MSLACTTFHRNCKCEFSSVWIPYVSGYGRGGKPHPENIYNKSCTCKACQFDDNGNEIEGWRAEKRPYCNRHVDICKVCPLCEFGCVVVNGKAA